MSSRKFGFFVFCVFFRVFYNQPPLQFYIRLINDYEWNRVDFVTFGGVPRWINPVFTALESQVSDGKLLGNIFFHKVNTEEGH